MEELSNYIEGIVDSVIYQNEENGYTVLRLDVGEEPVTVVGCMPGAAPGETLTAQGTWTHHATYGQQFKAEVARREMPVGEKAIFDYLASGAVRGIGLSTAKKMVEEFGDEALEVLENAPEKLTAIKGLTKKRAEAMGEAFRLQMGMRRLLDFLTAYGLPPQLGMPLYRRFGDRAREAVEANPYLLAEGELAIPFSQADDLAIRLGLADDHPQRLEAGVGFTLRHNLDNGHTFLPRQKLIQAASALLGVPDLETVEEALGVLEERGTVIREIAAGEEACYLAEYYEAETTVAQRISAMSGNELYPPEDLDRLIDQMEEDQGITYAPQQRLAVETAARHQVMLLTGGPGTGKTTSLKGILSLFESMGLKTALAAPTGRAAKRMGELCGMEGVTIHRLLETHFDPKTGALIFTHNERNPLKTDAVIVDETSMVDIILMGALLTGLREDCRLVLVGDPDQLPSVGAGNLLSDLIRSGEVPMVRLTEVFRQAAQSAIIRSAHQVNQGVTPELRNGSGQDVFFLRRTDPALAEETIVELVSRRLPERMGIPYHQIQVLSPTRKYEGGTGSLNRAIQAAVNPPAEGKGERKFGPYTFRQGDRVMQVKNNYDILWKTQEGLEVGMGVFNGDIGHIVEVDNRRELITVDFEGRVVEYAPDMLGELEPAYAVTVHKSQGSEYRAVVLTALDTAPRLLTRGVLYTAITRARELLVIVGDEGVVARMTANNRQAKRYSGLRWRLAGEGKS
ncbi:MAG: ATP-dependent RecD-like DNA helicase [Oscillospiraceae bacterium]|jgi:exodeoxyribonuclease V alpha subunit|nr:ATP-dependent RecD-like DNA helicase [Oscillospiraceae bacterium]